MNITEMNQAITFSFSHTNFEIAQGCFQVFGLFESILSCAGHQKIMGRGSGASQERIRNSKKGCIASVQGIYFQDEDLINTPTANTFAQLHAIDAKFNVTGVVKNFLEEAEI